MTTPQTNSLARVTLHDPSYLCLRGSQKNPVERENPSKVSELSAALCTPPIAAPPAHSRILGKPLFFRQQPFWEKMSNRLFTWPPNLKGFALSFQPEMHSYLAPGLYLPQLVWIGGPPWPGRSPRVSVNKLPALKQSRDVGFGVVIYFWKQAVKRGLTGGAFYRRLQRSSLMMSLLTKIWWTRQCLCSFNAIDNLLFRHLTFCLPLVSACAP